MTYYYGKNKAKTLFLKRDYLRALECYSQLYGKIMQDLNTLDSNSPKKLTKSNELKTIEILCILTDMALEHEEEARALFEYYQVLRTKKNAEAEDIIMEMVKNFDKNLYELSLVIANIQ
ncbi:MAG: hypothetical protein K2I63_04550, partial [Helicobacter sp.]|nr:hypothetical protein [Helicobacter sp.]